MRHYIFNGRYGDIIHALPAVYEYAKRTGTRPRMTVAAEFASVLDGCGWLEGYAAPVHWCQINDVLGYARNMFPQDDFVNMACYGKDYSCFYKCHSFLRDSWRLSQCPTPPETQPLVFDKRNPVREQSLIDNHANNNGKPFILVCTAGKSSPFTFSRMLLEDIEAARPDCQVVDISNVRADRVYDLLGLFERAVALVSIDTMHLHLARAVPKLPVLALICNGPTRWNRTDWQPGQVWRATYAEYTNMRPSFREALITLRGIPKICHVFSYNENASEETKRRIAVAQGSWEREANWAGNWKILPVHNKALPRTHADCQLPYVHDLINKAVQEIEFNGGNENDIVSFSNSDVGCIHGVTSYVLDTVREFGCAFSHRYDSNTRLDTALQSEAQVSDLRFYPGSDWFWFSVRWWKLHGPEMPDMIIGREFWDAVLRQIMKKYGSREITNAVWHEAHPNMWLQAGNRQNLPGNQHNRNLAMRWFVENGSNADDPMRSTWNIVPGLTQQVRREGQQLQPTGRQRILVAQPRGLVLPTRLQFKPNQPRRIDS